MKEQPNEPGGSKLGRFFEEKGFYIILFLCVAAIGIAGYVFFFSDAGGVNAALNNGAATSLTDALAGWEDTDLPSLSSTQAEDSPVFGPSDGVIATTAATTAGTATTPAATSATAATTAPPATTAATTKAPHKKTTKAKKNTFFVRPVPGEVLYAFSGDELVYDRTMGDWRTHNGADFTAADGDKVYAIADATVADVYSDSYYGTSILLDHGDGLQSVYVGLVKDATVTVGQTVKAGDVIGAVDAGVLFESALPIHVHVEVLKDGKRVDPMSVIPS